jgi:hypothetical protein
LIWNSQPVHIALKIVAHQLRPIADGHDGSIFPKPSTNGVLLEAATPRRATSSADENNRKNRELSLQNSPERFHGLAGLFGDDTQHQ